MDAAPVLCSCVPSITQWRGWQFDLLMVEVVFSGIIPLSKLFVNLCVIENLRGIIENRRCMIASHKIHDEKPVRYGGFRSTTIVLLAVLMLMICSTLPVGVKYVCRHFFTNVDPYLSIFEAHNDSQCRVRIVWSVQRVVK